MVIVKGLELSIEYWYCKKCDKFYLEDENHDITEVDPRPKDVDGTFKVTKKDDLMVPPVRTKGFSLYEPGVAEAMGNEGEKVIDAWMRENHLRYVYLKQKEYYKGGPDFKVDTNGQSHRIDVKNRPAMNSKGWLNTEFQMKADDCITYDFYIGVCGGEIKGWLTGKEVAALPVDATLPCYPGRHIPYSQMHPISELLKILKGVKK